MKSQGCQGFEDGEATLDCRSRWAPAHPKNKVRDALPSTNMEPHRGDGLEYSPCTLGPVDLHAEVDIILWFVLPRAWHKSISGTNGTHGVNCINGMNGMHGLRRLSFGQLILVILFFVLVPTSGSRRSGPCTRSRMCFSCPAG